MPRRVVLAVLLSSATVHADSEADAKRHAAALFEEGRALASQGRDTEACDKFLQSLELEPALGTELNLADCLQRQGVLRRAWGYYDHVARVAKREGDVLRAKFARERADALEPQLATVIIKRADPNVQITINERAVRNDGEGTTLRELVDPGDIVIEATAPGRKKHTAKLTVVRGKTGEVSIPALAEVEVPLATGGERKRRGWVYVAAGLGGLAIIDFGFAAVAANTARVRQVEFETYGCAVLLDDLGNVGDKCRNRLSDLHDWQAIAIWSTLIGATLASSATAVYILAPTERVTITPAASATHVGVALTAQF